MKWVLVSLAFLIGLAAGFYAGRQSAVSLALPAPAKGTSEIKLSAVVDGSDRFVFAGESAWNEHLQWQPPRNVLLNDAPWTDLTIAPTGWPERAREIDLTKATIVDRKGRDVITLEPTADGFVVYFSDTPMGSANYEVTITVPRK